MPRWLRRNVRVRIFIVLGYKWNKNLFYTSFCNKFIITIGNQSPCIKFNSYKKKKRYLNYKDRQYVSTYRFSLSI